MLISKVSLSNFKNFDNIEVYLGNMNVIVGANASGKSNFVQSVKFINDIQKYGIENAISLQGGIDYLRNIKLKDRKIIKVYLEMAPQGGTVLDKLSGKGHILGLKIKKFEYFLEIAAKSKGKYEIVKEELRYSTQIEEIFFDDEKDSVRGNYLFSISVVKGKLSYYTDISENQTTVFLINGEKKIIDNDKINPFIVAYGFFKDDFNKKQTLIEQFSFLVPRNINEFKVYDFDLKNSKKPSSITSKAELEENGENLAVVLKNILGDENQHRKFANLLTDILPFVKSVDTEKSQDNSLFFRVREVFNNNTVIPSSLLSDGTISITAIVTALFFEDSNFAAFEEPEHGIHPALIAKLMSFFYDASKRKQIVITTHSPEILRNTKIDDLFLVTRNSIGLTSITKPGDQEMVKAFLENELGIDQLFVQNLLDA